MNTQNVTNPVELSSMIASVVDAFIHYVDKDGLHTLLTTCLDLAGFQSGQVSLVDSALMIDLSVCLNGKDSNYRLVQSSTTDYLSNCAMNTLVTKFSITGENSKWKTEYAIPLRIKGRAIGVLTLFDDKVISLEPKTLAVLEHVCDVAAATISLTYQIQQSRLLVSQLQTALDSRVVLEQAKGVLAERMKVDFPTAFQEIRNNARREQRPIHHVAADIIAGVPLHL